MPDLDPIPNTPGRAEIVDLYAKSLARLKAIIMSIDATDAGKRKAAENIIAIQRFIKALKAGNAAWAKEYIPESYKTGWAQDKKLLERYLGNDYTEQFSMMHHEASRVAVIGAAMDLNVIADAMEDTFVGYVRRAQLAGARRAIAQEIAGGIIEGASRQTVSNRLMNDLRTRAVNGLVTVGKVTMRADSYAELLARTISRAARTEGTLNRLNEHEIDLVIFTNTGATDFCVQYEDRVFSISGRSKKYPILTARPPLHPNSVGNDVEIYTEDGWKLAKDMIIGEKCLSLNPETKEIEYVPVIQKFEHLEKEMISFSNRSFNMLVTINHQMLFMNDWTYKHGKKALNFKIAQDFIGKKSGVFYRSCEWKVDNPEFIVLGSKTITFNQYVQFMAWYLSDGFTTESCNQVAIAQDATKSEETHKEIHDLLYEMGYDKHSHGQRGFVIQDKALTTELVQYGKSNQKFIPKKIKMASSDMILFFLETFVKADGYRKKNKEWKGGQFRDSMDFFTTSKRMADDLGELILKAGMRPSFRLQKNKGKMVHHKNGDYAGNYDVWVISACYSQYANISALNIECVPYDDMAYCVELEKYHTLWVRRNGKTVWIGNCTHSISGFIEQFSNPEEIEYGQGFNRADVGKSAKEMAKKYPQTKEDKRVRTKAA